MNPKDRTVYKKKIINRNACYLKQPRFKTLLGLGLYGVIYNFLLQKNVLLFCQVSKNICLDTDETGHKIPTALKALPSMLLRTRNTEYVQHLKSF